MIYLIGAVIVFLAICGIVKAASGDRYANMTAEEFEEEAKRGSPTSGMVSAFQKIVDPGHTPEFMQEQKQRIEIDGAESGGLPKPDAFIPPATRPKH